MKDYVVEIAPTKTIKCVKCGGEFESTGKKFGTDIDDELCPDCDWILSDEILGDVDNKVDELIRKYNISNANAIDYMEWGIEGIKELQKIRIRRKNNERTNGNSARTKSTKGTV